MAKTSKGVILSQASQIKSDYSFALIKATADNKSLVQDTSSAELKVNALVEYSKDSQWDPKKLTNLGFPAGCFLIVDLRGQDIHAADLITNLALVRQYGYQAGVIDDLSTLDDIKALKANQIYLINSGKTNDDQDASLNGNEITDGSGKLAVGMSVKWQRDYTNVDVSGDHAGFVGMGQDTLLKGGNAFGYSTNGRDFNAVITPKGLIFRRPDAERMWRLLKPNEIADINSTVGDKVKKEVDSATAEIPAAVSAANSAVSAAESAVAASKVNSDAIVAQSEAISEAKSAMDSATAEIQQTAANAASDAAKIRADVARVQNEVDNAKTANSASVDALKSDIDTAKQDLANVHDSLTKAQSAVEQNQKLINDSVAKISNDIAQDRKDLATAQQNNADLAKQLDDYSKQAEAQGKTIKSIQNDQNGFTTTLADVKGNVSQVSDKVDGLSAGLKDAQGNIASVKAQADQLNVTLSDHSKNIAQLTATAKELSSTLEDADGRLSKVEQTASEQSTTLSDLQGDLSQVKQTADGLVTTLKDAQGDIDQIKQTAKGTSEQLADVQGNVTNIQKDIDGLKQTTADNAGNIHTLQSDSKSLHDSMQDAQGDISTLKKTSTDVTAELQDHAGRISKTEQTASTLVNELADQQGHLNRVEQTAQGTQQTVANQQGQINNIKTDAAGIHETITGQSNQIANINVTLSGLNSKYEGVSGDLGKLKDQVTTNSTQITQNQQAIVLKADQDTVNNLTGEVSRNKAQLEVQAGQISSKVSSDDFKTLDGKVGGAIAQIHKNSTAIDQANKEISLKADQTEVNEIKGTASQNSSRLDVMDGQISSKVTSTDVNNIVDKKGYVTTSTVQSLVDQKAGTINESITNLTNEVNTRNGVNLLKGTKDFSGSWHNYGSTNYWHTENLIDPNGNHSVKSDSLSWYGYYQPIYLDTGDYTFSGYYYSEGGKPVYFYVKPNSGDNLVEASYTSNLDSTPNGWRWFVVHFKVTKAGNAAVRLESGQNQVLHIASYKLERGTVTKPVWTPAPSDNATVTQVQQITASIDGLQSRVTNLKNDTSSKITQLSNTIQSKVSSSDFKSKITQLANDINLRVTKGDLLSQINLTAGNTLIQSNKIYLDSSSTVFSGKAFIPSAAIVSLDADKINTGTLNTQMVSIGDDQTRLWARSNYLYLTGKDQGDAYNMRIGGDKIEFVTTEIPNNAPYMDGITPMYQIAYDGDTKSRLKIRSFNRLTGSNEFPIEMYDSVNISKDEIDLAANNQMKLSIRDDGVHVRRSLFFENGGGTGVFGGFTRADNSNIVEFSSGDNNGENFRIDCGARFMQYVYINGNARAQSWLTNSTLSKKTNIRKLDQQIALDKIRQDDQYLYEYKRNIEQGIYDPQASFIIDDVNDVSHYSVPREFIDQSGNYREPNVELAYLIAAFQAIDKQVQKQKEEIKELKEKLQHE